MPSKNVKFLPLATIISLTACGTLMQQVMLTRLFSVQVFYHFAFAAVAITMAGLTIGAVNVYTKFRKTDSASITGYLKQSLLRYFGLSLALAVLILVHGYFNILAITVTLSIILVLMAFVQSGCVIALLLTRFSKITPKLYAADLIGASLGCWLTLILLDKVGLINSLFFAAFLPLISLAVLNKKKAYFAVIGFSVFAILSTIYIQMPNLFKVESFNDRLSEEHLGSEYEKWNSYSRVLVSKEVSEFPDDKTISEKAPNRDKPAPHKILLIDFTASTILTAFDGDEKKISYLKHDITSSPYNLRKINDVAVIGVGGGRDVLVALVNNSANVLGIEVNQSIYNLFTNIYSDYIGHLAKDPRVTIANDEARGYLARLQQPVDLIQISLVDTWAAVASGAFGLTENGLYTTDAWQIFYDRLSDKGVLSLTRWYNEEHVGELYRMLPMAHDVLTKNNITDVPAHIAIIYNPAGKNATMMISKSPITAAERANLAWFAKVNGFVAMDLKEQNINDLLTTGKLSSAHYNLDLTPPTDSRPFFFNMARPYHAFIADLAGDKSENANNNMAVQILLCVIIGMTIIMLAVIFMPLLKSGKELKKQKIAYPFTYFAMLGLGFMFVEIPLIQYFSLYLGKPALALVVALFGLLIFSGVGSYFSLNKIIPNRVKLLLLTAFVGIGVYLLPIIIKNTYVQPESIRVVICLLFMLALGFWMGMGFPIGLNAVDKKGREQMLPWLWAINGGASVVGSAAALLVAIFYGLPFAMGLGVACYVVAWLIYPKLAR